MMKAAVTAVSVLALLQSASAVQLITHRLTEEAGQVYSHAIVHPDNSTQFMSFVSEELRQEIFLERKAPSVNKWILALIVQLGLGSCGVDRCYLGQLMLGTAKAVTCGGCGIWYFIDYVIISVNCLMFWESMDTFFMNASFQKDDANIAFWITVVGLIFQCCSGYFSPKHKAAGALRRKGLFTKKPTEYEIKKTFEELDADGNGNVSADELKQGCENMGLCLSDEEFKALMKKLDVNKDGKIDFSEFFEHFSKAD